MMLKSIMIIMSVSLSIGSSEGRSISTNDNYPVLNLEANPSISTNDNYPRLDLEADPIDSFVHQAVGLDSISKRNNSNSTVIPRYSELLYTDEPRSFWLDQLDAKANVRHARSFRSPDRYDSYRRYGSRRGGSRRGSSRRPGSRRGSSRRRGSRRGSSRRRGSRGGGRSSRRGKRSTDDGFNHSFTNNVPGSNVDDPSKSNPQVGFGSGHTWYSSPPLPSFHF